MSHSKNHDYKTHVRWIGNTGSGTKSYRSYDRYFAFTAPGKETSVGSADPAFRGDASKFNPEEMLVIALSACHMLWYLHLCADANVTVLEYYDTAEGVMIESPDGGGFFKQVTLHPTVLITDANDLESAGELHAVAHRKCFIANSVSFPVECQPRHHVQGQPSERKKV